MGLTDKSYEDLVVGMVAHGRILPWVLHISIKMAKGYCFYVEYKEISSYI